MYKGYYAGQDVAVKILKDVHENEQQYQEFLQEVSIMRKVRHKNVVQFIGACTRKPNLCIVFEFMQGGSVFDYMRRHGPLSIEQVRAAAHAPRRRRVAANRHAASTNAPALFPTTGDPGRGRGGPRDGLFAPDAHRAP